MFRLLLWLRDRRTLIWVVPAAAVVVAVGLCLFAALVDVAFPNPVGWPEVDQESLDSLLVIIASSMLAVATFSLGVMVSAFSSASTGATPRATELVMGDEGTRDGISAFIGAFVYAVVAKTALSFDAYDQAGRVTLMVATLIVLVYLVVRLILWVRTMASLGRLTDTLERIDRQTRTVLHAYADHPDYGARPVPIDAPPAEGVEVWNRGAGYLTHVDFGGLQELAEAEAATIRILVRPGAFVGPRTQLAVVTPDGDRGHGDPDGVADRVRRSFLRDEQRSFDQDPRFGLIVLSEVAQRAMSPAVNDPGTCIQVVSLLTQIIVDLQDRRARREDPSSPRLERVEVIGLDERDFITDGFAPIARDAAAFLEVALRLQKLLWQIANHEPGPIADAAAAQARDAYDRSMAAFTLDADRTRLQEVHRELWPTGAA